MKNISDRGLKMKNISDKGLFDEILTRIQAQVPGLRILRSKQDTYVAILMDDELIGGFNCADQNLAVNIIQLGSILNANTDQKLFY